MKKQVVITLTPEEKVSYWRACAAPKAALDWWLTRLHDDGIAAKEIESVSQLLYKFPSNATSDHFEINYIFGY